MSIIREEVLSHRCIGNEMDGSCSFDEQGGLAPAQWNAVHECKRCLCHSEGQQIIKKADLIAALSLEAFDGRIEPFMDCIQQIRPHKVRSKQERLFTLYSKAAK